MAIQKKVVTKDPVTIRRDMGISLKNSLMAKGVANPNVGPTSDFDGVLTALANEMAMVHANQIVSIQDMDWTTAGEEALNRVAGPVFDTYPQPAEGSVGSIVLDASATTSVVTDLELTDEQGQRFKVLVGGTYSNGMWVPIKAIDTGYSTNHEAGDVLTWSSAPPFCSDRVKVAPGGLVNGTDGGDVENVRQRMFSKLRNPPGSGNDEDVAEAIEKSHGSVQKAFVYPAVQGPSTCDAAAVAAPTETNKSRKILAVTMSGTVVPYAQGKLARQGDLNVTTVDDVPTDVSFGISIPNAPTANSPGKGGGWKNGTLWPAPDGVTKVSCKVTAVTSDSEFTVDAIAPPTRDVTRIAWLSPYTWKLHQAVVTHFTGSSGAYAIVVDTPFVGITTDCFIWPDCENAQAYVDAVLAAYAVMGPGEKTNNVSALRRGYRHPQTDMAWPSSLGPHLLNALTATRGEVAAAGFLYRTDGTTTVTGSAGSIYPQVPAALSDPPKIFIPRHIGFYRLPA